MVQVRKLVAAEMQLARTVYASAIPFDRVYITDLSLGSAVTLAGMDLSTGKFDYTVNWPDGFDRIMTAADRRATLIHELCHVWQGENGIWPTFYMGQSLWSQLSSGVRDIWKTRKWRGWGTHRSTAYKFPSSAIGNPWTSFNVEQQASLVESWYMPERERIRPAGPGRVYISDFGDGITGGDRSIWDSRSPYIRDVIRARNRGAAYRPITPPNGGDPQIKAIQDRLVALGYLEGRHADGLVGRSNSATLDAVEAFQRRNGPAGRSRPWRPQQPDASTPGSPDQSVGARAMIRALIAAALVLTACGPDSGGPLKPVDAPGVELSQDPNGDPAATIQSNTVSARVSASWSDIKSQSALIVYTNNGPTPVSIELGAMTMTGPAGEAVVMSVADLTGTNLVDERSDNDEAIVLVQRDGEGVARGKLDLPPGAERRVDASFSSFSNTTAAAAGDAITFHLPMPGASSAIKFVADRPSLLPF